MKNSAIEWTHHTFNPWIGCTKISAGCKNCYAAAQDNRWGHDRWGDSKLREQTTPAYWRKPLQWNLEARQAGERQRVFCASLADVFEDRPDLCAPRFELFDLIRRTPSLDWLLLTKRPNHIRDAIEVASDPGDQKLSHDRDDDQALTIRWADRWANGEYPDNVWLGATVEDQARTDRIAHLLGVPARVHFLSCEPLLERVDLSRWVADLDWVIAGGESGGGARKMEPAWAKSLRDQCAAHDVPFLFKQWGDFDAKGDRVGKKIAGRQLEGVQHDGYPKVAA